MTLRFAYNTNGCANHRLSDAIDLIASAGYDGIALTLDWHHFDPFAPDWQSQAVQLRKRLADAGLGSVIETGARYLLDPAAKHEPTLITSSPEGRKRRRDFLIRACEIAALLESEAVSFWAGVPRPGVSGAEAWNWLVEGTAAVTTRADELGVTASFEPEPGMLVETVPSFLDLKQQVEQVGGPLHLALDIGHLWVTGEMDPAEAPSMYAEHIGTAAIEGMERGVHVHLPLGEGDMDVGAVLEGFQSINFDKLLCVELSRESPRAHEAIPQSIEWLRARV
jgi:sugar phosphate isomerase/epimerase